MTLNTVLAFSEKPALLEQLLGGASRQTSALGWKIAVLGVGKDVSNLADFGEDLLFQVDADALDPELVASALSAAIAQSQPSVVLIGATKLGLEVGPRIAERIGAGYAAWVVGFDVNGDAEPASTSAQCMLYTGTGLVTYKFMPGPVVLSVAPGAFEAAAATGKTAEIKVLEAATTPSRVSILEYRPKPTSGARLEDARLVVDVGQGVKQREDVQIVQKLADLVGGQLACSRPISSDRDWFPEWVGLSGTKIKPELCLTVGVSGAIQHIVGIRESRLIAAVNIDADAPIFSQADYGVVADLYEFLPALIERLQARGIRAPWMS